jgi:hypothetical protein
MATCLNNVEKHDDFLRILKIFGDFVFTKEGIFHIIYIDRKIYNCWNSAPKKNADLEAFSYA